MFLHLFLYEAKVRISYNGEYSFFLLYFKSILFGRFVEMMSDTYFMGSVIKEEENTKVLTPSQQCFPLFSFIKALEFPTVNLLR